jgi:hypothetical protein
MHRGYFLVLDLVNVIMMYDIFDSDMRWKMGCPKPAWTTTTWFYVACGIQVATCLDLSMMGRFRRAVVVVCFLMGAAQQVGILHICQTSLWSAVQATSVVFLGVAFAHSTRPCPTVTIPADDSSIVFDPSTSERKAITF